MTIVITYRHSHDCPRRDQEVTRHIEGDRFGSADLPRIVCGEPGPFMLTELERVSIPGPASPGPVVTFPIHGGAADLLVQLHAGDPGPTGAEHVSAGNPDRHPVVMGLTGDRLEVWTLPRRWLNRGATERLTHLSVWAAGGSFVAATPIDGAEWGPGDSFAVAALKIDLAPGWSAA